MSTVKFQSVGDLLDVDGQGQGIYYISPMKDKFPAEVSFDTNSTPY